VLIDCIGHGYLLFHFGVRRVSVETLDGARFGALTLTGAKPKADLLLVRARADGGAAFVMVPARVVVVTVFSKVGGVRRVMVVSFCSMR
jgi:hypothetical protein